MYTEYNETIHKKGNVKWGTIETELFSLNWVEISYDNFMADFEWKIQNEPTLTMKVRVYEKLMKECNDTAFHVLGRAFEHDYRNLENPKCTIRRTQDLQDEKIVV